MSLIIKYIATVNVETGVIENVGTAPGADLPVEGIVDGKEIVWIPSEGWEGKDNLTIHEEYYRREGTWFHRGPRPTPSHTWNVNTRAWEFDPVDFWAGVRFERDQKLFFCDWTILPDSPLTASKKTEWETYRQQLRDIPSTNQNVTSVSDITWPTPPA